MINSVAGRRKEKFSELCKLICPDFLERSNSAVVQAANVLHNVRHSLENLYEQAKKFKEAHPEGIKVKDEIPVIGGGVSNHQKLDQYKKDVRAFLLEHTGMEVPVDIALSRTFYAEIINYCIKIK